MKISEKTLKWLLRFYPPLFFQRIWVKSFHPHFRGVEVKISPSLLNKNYNSSIFGGTIFAAADPFYPILFNEIFKSKGYKIRVWLKSGHIKYVKPARSILNFVIKLSEEDINAAEKKLIVEGKYIAKFHLNLIDMEKDICAIVENEVYIRDLNFRAKKP